ncbi:MAG: hypothetical protein U1C46_03885 [Bacteroidales bacterium]|nr:hypothetical protein [Bacteroidales bacterium]
MPKLLKVLLLIPLLLIPTTLINAQETNVAVSIHGESEKSQIRKQIFLNNSELLTLVNSAFQQNAPELIVSDSFATRNGITSILEMWNKGTFYFSADTTDHNLLITHKGYQIRNMHCLSGHVTKYEIIIDYAPDGRIDGLNTAVSNIEPGLPLFPLTIKSEKTDLCITLEGMKGLSQVVIENEYKTPGKMMLPYGKYRVALDDEGIITYKGKLAHYENRKNIKMLPSYSSSSLHFLTADYININSMEASLGRIVLFPQTGLSTSILTTKYHVFEDEQGEEYKTLIPSVLLLNWDWRIGGSILRQFDICALGRVKWAPGLKILKINLEDFYDATVWDYFLGMELSSRISFFNINFRIGHQVFDGVINVWSEENAAYSDNTIKVIMGSPVVSAGITFTGKVAGANNLLRVWRKPLANQLRDGLW